MVNITTAKTEPNKKTRGGRRAWSHFVRVMAMVVVFCTTYALILPAITIESGTICGIGEHTHTGDCYQAVETVACTIPEGEGHTHADACYTIEENALTCALEEVAAHTHSEACNGQTLVCGQEEAAAHVHSEACTGEVKTLVCTEAESETHAHADACYQVEALTCALTETEGHAHADACYEAGVVCGLEETEGHAHAEACYGSAQTLTCALEESEGHSHADDEQPMELICELNEHVHIEACYPVTEATTEEATEETAQPVSDPTADVESAADWEASMAAVELTGDWSADLLNIARSQMGYTESARNFVVSESGSVSGYTRYGAWYGIPYGDWCAMFVSFCLDYAGVEDISRHCNCVLWLENLISNKQYYTADKYTPVPGDIIFFNWNEGEDPDHVGIVEQIIIPEIAENPEEQEPVKVRVIEGNSSNRVQYVDYAIDDATIMGYGVLPTEPGPSFEYADDSVQVNVVLPLDTTVPETAVLKVTPIESEAEEYDSLVEKANNAVDGTVTKIKLYDISFYTENDEYIPVDDEAKVSIRFVESAVDANANVEVLHFAEDNAAPVVLAGVTIDEQVPAADEAPKTLEELAAEQATPVTEAAPETVVEFTTDGFSMFAVVEVDFTKDYHYLAMNEVDTTKLGGKTFVLATANGSAVLAENIKGTIVNEGRDDPKNDIYYLAQQAVTYDADGLVTINTNTPEDSQWLFIHQGESNYYIQSVSTGEYLYIGRDRHNMFGEAFVSDSQTPPLITVANTNNGITFRSNGENNRYLTYEKTNKWFTADKTAKNNTDVANSYFSLCEAAVATTKPATVENNQPYTDLDGKVFVISTSGEDDASGETSAMLNVLGGTGDDLASEPVVSVTADGATTIYASAEDLNTKLWRFVAVNAAAGQYRIQSVATNNYLRLYDSGNGMDFGGTPSIFTVVRQDGTGNPVIKVSDTRVLCYDATNDYFTTYTTPNAEGRQRGSLVISEYTGAVPAPDYNTDATDRQDLNGQYFMIVAVDNTFDAANTANRLPALTNGIAKGNAPSEIKVSVDGVEQDALDGQTIGFNVNFENGNNFNTYYNLVWYFEAADKADRYHIRAYDVNSQQWVGYLNIGANWLTVGNANHSFEVMEALNADNENAIVLRGDNSEYYVSLYGNISYNEEETTNTGNNIFISSTGYTGTAGREERGNHLVLSGHTEVNKVTSRAQELFDGLKVENGTYVFSDKALTGSATEKNGPENQGRQTNSGDNDDSDFPEKYDNAQAYRQHMQNLARDIRAVMNADVRTDVTLSDGTVVKIDNNNDKQYIRAAIEALSAKYGVNLSYDELIGNEENAKLKWLWAELKTVTPAKPLATVNLFNYSDGTVAGQPDVNSFPLSEKYGFNFYHKIQYSAYTAENVQTRDNSEEFGCNDSGLVFAPALNATGVPEVTRGWDKGSDPDQMQSVAADDDGSLAYLFSQKNSPYYVTTMGEGGGLFQYDTNTGYYYYHSNQNAAHWDAKSNKFVLYDAVIRPMYVPAGEKDTPGGANNNEDRYNFLPFDDPANTAIVDPNTMHVTWEAANGEDMAWDKTSAYLNERPDMWFGMTIDTNFFMPSNGQVLDPKGELQDMVFKFHGDDDTLIYINGVLVVDIGGVHGAEDGWINFATGEVFYEDRPNGNNEFGTLKTVRKNIQRLMIDNFMATTEYANATDAEILDVLKSKYGIDFEPGINGQPTLKQYTTYTMDFFYMERGGNVSYCGIEYNLVEVPSNSLTIAKEVDADTNDDGIDDVIDTNLTYTYRVVQVENGKESDKNYFPVNTPYTIYEGIEEKGTGYVDANGYITLKEGQRAEFLNITNPYEGQTTIPDYIVQEILPNGEVGQYNVWYTCIGTEVTQAVNPTTGLITAHTIYQTAPIRISGSQAQYVTFINEVKDPTGSLAIQKKLKEGTSDLPFTVKIETGGISAARAIAGVNTAEYSKIEKGTLYKLYTVEPNGDLTEIPGTVELVDKDGKKHYYHEVTSTDGTITLYQNQRAVFDGILAGTYFKITEVLATGQNFAPTYEGVILNADEIDESTIVQVDASGVYGTFTQDDADVLATITNDVSLTKVELAIEKTVSNWFGSDSFEFDTKRIENVTFDNNGIPSFTDADLHDVANPSVSINGVEGTTSFGTNNVVFNFKQDDVAKVQGDTATFYFRVTELENNNKSFIYDKSVYVVEVTLTKHTEGTEVTWTGEVTRVWEDSDGNAEQHGYVLLDADANTAGAQAPDSLDFENYRYTRVLVRKLVSGVVTNDTFTFEATVFADFVGGEDGYEEGEDLPFDLRLNPPNIAEGSGLTINEDTPNVAEFSIKHGETQIIYVPYGATVIVKETKVTDEHLVAVSIDESGYITTHEVDGGTLTDGVETAPFEVNGDSITVGFRNESTTSVKIQKVFEGDANSEFEFTATITPPSGAVRTEEFSLKNGGEWVIDEIPYGSTIKVEETNGAGYLTTYHTTTKIEAESGASTGNVYYQKQVEASGGILLGNILGDTGTVTLNPKFNTAGVYELKLHYNQDATRSFVVDVNGTSDTYAGQRTGGWGTTFLDLIVENAPIIAGTNSIVIGGTTEDADGNPAQNTAPNLDYVELTSPETGMTLTHALTEYVNGEMTIVITNEVGYELPESGGEGTLMYILGGLFLMAVPVVYYGISKRSRRERRAGA